MRPMNRRVPPVDQDASVASRASGHLVRITRRIGQRVRARLDVPRWVRRLRSDADERTCILACFAADGRVGARALALGRAWRGGGYRVLLVVASERPGALEWDAAWSDACDGLLVRRNFGYDFGSWSAALRALPEDWCPSILALANDSVYGPLRGFDALLAQVEQSAADVVGLTDSYDYWHHLQSYLTFYKPGAFRSRAFRRFWRTTWAGERGDIIWHAELRLLQAMKAGGLRVDVLYPAPAGSTVNATLQQWRELIASGFPFVKVQLLRDNPEGVDLGGWQRVLVDAGFDPAAVEVDLGPRFERSSAGQSLRTGATTA